MQAMKWLRKQQRQMVNQTMARPNVIVITANDSQNFNFADLAKMPSFSAGLLQNPSTGVFYYLPEYDQAP
jgi:hypothetical protein